MLSWHASIDNIILTMFIYIFRENAAIMMRKKTNQCISSKQNTCQTYIHNKHMQYSIFYFIFLFFQFFISYVLVYGSVFWFCFCCIYLLMSTEFWSLWSVIWTNLVFEIELKVCFCDQIVSHDSVISK